MFDPLKYYSILNINEDATDQEIKAQFQRLSRHFHPDKQPDHLKRAAQELFSQLEQAKFVLSDPYRKFAYDNYGIDGLKVLQNMQINKIESFQQFIKKFQSKISSQIGQKKFLDLNPSFSLTIETQLSDYLDNIGKRYEGQPWKFQLQRNSIQLQQFVRLNISKNLHCNFGVIASNRDSIGTVGLHQSFNYIFPQGLIGQLNFQLSSRNSLGLSLTKQIGENNTIYGGLQFNSAGVNATTQFSHQFSDTWNSKLTYTFGNSSNFNFILTKQYEKFSVKPELSINSQSTEFKLLYFRNFLKKFEGRIGIINDFFQDEDDDLQLNVGFEIGIKQELSNQSKADYGMQISTDSVKFIAKYKVSYVNFEFPITLSKNETFQSIFVSLGMVLTSSLATFYVGNYINKRNNQYLLEKQQKVLNQINENKIFSNEYQSQIKSQVTQSRQENEEMKGLIILKAFYGHPQQIKTIRNPNTEPPIETIEVSDFIQILVRNNKLTLSDSSKSSINGIYNPCYDDNRIPQLLVFYKFNEIVTSVLINDTDPLKLPY